MTLLAVGAIASFVYVVGLVAAIARGGRFVCRRLGSVASITTQGLMRAFQLKLRIQRVIKAGLLPGLAVVAIIALLTKSTEMYVVNLVATCAFFVSALIIIAAMALRTAQFPMFV